MKKLVGAINLSRIPKQKIRDTKSGEKILYVDIVPNREPDKYGNTHSIQVWDKDMGTIYLGNLKEEEFGRKKTELAEEQYKQAKEEAHVAEAPVEAKVEYTDDLPF